MKNRRLGLQMFDAPGGALVADWSNIAVDIEEENAEHGFSILSFHVALGAPERFRYYDYTPMNHLSLNHGGGVVWEGRVEDREITATGLRITAFGYWSALADGLYTAFWSHEGVSGWNETTSDLISSRDPARYSMSKGDGILNTIPNINESYGSTHRGTDVGSWYFRIPDGSTRNIQYLQFSLNLNVPTDWRLRVNSWSGGFASSTVLVDVTSTGSQIQRAYIFQNVNKPIIEFMLYYTSTSTTLSGETGDYFAKLSNIRVTSTVANIVDTDTSTTITAGSDVVVTPTTMDNIYVGQNIVINRNGTTSETVQTTAITASTFTADFVNSYSGTTLVDTAVVYADEIVKDIISTVSTLNSSQLSTSTALVESPGVDIINASYSDVYCNDVINSLLGVDATGGRWEAGIWEGQTVYYRSRGSQARTFYTDALELRVNSTAATLRNQYYATYKNGNGRTLRTATADNAASQSRYGVVRQGVAQTNTTNSTLAGTYRDAALDNNKDITPSSQVICKGLYTAGGAEVPFWMIRAGDTLTIRNLPPNASTDIDKIRTFTVAGRKYYPNTDEVSIIPELDTPSVAFLLTRVWIPPGPAIANPSQVVTDSGNPFGSAVTGTTQDDFNFFD